MKQFSSALLALFALVTLSACSEVEFGSHLFKKYGEEAPPPQARTIAPTQQGLFKVGKPYTVLGQTYVPRETYDYVETGIASWYGPGFHGGKTACGESYDKNELTAAHRTLQMPSLVRVTNLGNGRSVVVRVNDRGPFSKGRVIDVSRRAAEALNMVGTGTAKVKVELLANESRILADAARQGVSTRGVEIAMNETGTLPGYITSKTGSSICLDPKDQPIVEKGLEQVAQKENISGHYTDGHFYPAANFKQVPVVPSHIYVQAGAFGVEGNAMRLSQKLSSIAPTSVQPVPYQGRTLYKVRVGPLDSVPIADNVLKRVLASGQSDAIIVVQ